MLNQCKSKVEQTCSRVGNDATEEMKKQPRTRAHQRNGLDIDQAAKSIKKALDMLTKESLEIRNLYSVTINRF